MNLQSSHVARSWESHCWGDNVKSNKLNGGRRWWEVKLLITLITGILGYISQTKQKRISTYKYIILTIKASPGEYRHVR